MAVGFKDYCFLSGFLPRFEFCPLCGTNKHLTFQIFYDIITQTFGDDNMEILEKLKILADSAKYDASCSSSGSLRKNMKGRYR